MRLMGRTPLVGELNGRYDIEITIQTKNRYGKLLYIFQTECDHFKTKYSQVLFDLIDESRFYSEIKKETISFAKSCLK